ncbi:MAG: PAS domain S-box protein [Nitrospiraceae bacterium]|nr:MAG: PAS domain S-box protein [Nitrospiraceae bacterium]
MTLPVFRYRRVMISFIAILLASFSVVVAVILAHEREMLDDARRATFGDLELMGAFVQDAVLRHDYAAVEQFLEHWGEGHEDIIELKATAANNFIISHYRRGAPSNYSFPFKNTIQYAGRDLVTLEMARDFSSIRDSLDRFMLRLISGSVLFTVLLGITLWYSMKKLALVPMEREIAIRREAEKKFRTLMDSAPDAMIYVDGDGKIALVNEQTERLFGYPRQELQGKEIEILMPERFRGIHREKRTGYYAKPKARAMGAGLDLYGLARDGREFPVDIGLSPVETEEGTFVLADIRDITDRKAAEKKIERAYYFQSAISSILQISLSPVSFEEQLGRMLDIVLSIPFLPLLSKGCIYLVEDDPEVLVMKVHRGYTGEMQTACAKVRFGVCLCGLAASKHEVISCENIDDRHEIQYKGMMPHSNYCIPVLSGENVLGVISLLMKEGYKRNKEDDALMSSIANTMAGVIERRHAEQEKQRLQEQLVQVEKLSALGRLTANVAHEIRNPLTSIGGYARRLNKKISGEADEKTYTEIIIAEANRLERILRNVLVYSSETRLNLGSHDIREIINDSLNTFEVLCHEKSIRVEKLFADAPLIITDKEQIREVINNIVSNAIDSMPAGGLLTVSVKKEVRNGMQYLNIKITDTGKGIPEDKLKRVFEPFFTTKVLEHGTGLGLAISKKIIEDHGGFIRVESEAGKGSTFNLYLPYEKRSHHRENGAKSLIKEK